MAVPREAEPIFTYGHYDRALKLYKNSFEPRTIKCVKPLQRELPRVLTEVKKAVKGVYKVEPFVNIGEFEDEDIFASTLVVSAAYSVHQNRAGKDAECTYTPRPDRLHVLFADVFAGYFEVSGLDGLNGPHTDIYLRTVLTDEALIANGPAPETYFPFSSLQIH